MLPTPGEAVIAEVLHVVLCGTVAGSHVTTLHLQHADAIALPCRYDAFADLLQNRTAATQYVTLNYKAANSVDKAVGDSISSDLYLVAISVVTFIVLAVVFMSR
jgi:hypothetical protein